MTTAMITACFSGLVRAVGILLSVIISSEFIYILLFTESPEEIKEQNLFNPTRLNRLFSGACYSAKENSVGNPYRFKKPKLTARAVGFIFLYPGEYRFAICSEKNLSSTSGNNYSIIQLVNYHSSTWQRNDVTRTLCAGLPMQNSTTCL
ncbi:MAG TPA: hypothetical protein VFI33_15115 [Puia sp.]|nr:hypothetical protein [Puia sp.]